MQQEELIRLYEVFGNLEQIASYYNTSVPSVRGKLIHLGKYKKAMKPETKDSIIRTIEATLKIKFSRDAKNNVNFNKENLALLKDAILKSRSDSKSETRVSE